MGLNSSKGQIFFGVIIILMTPFVSSSPNDEEAPTEQLRNLSLEQLLNVKISPLLSLITSVRIH